ncbi:MAG: CHAP domain-containing protein [Nocardioidaceae bacterium]
MLLRVRVLAALLCLLTAGGLDLLAVPASASETVLCSGYRACSQQGMDASGYAHVNDQMFWRMYAGHNCTNYAAYRMVHNGMPNVRPWSGDGNATNWGRLNPSITDATPRVGAIAWWRAGDPPAGSAGHVAYVEQVLSPDEIVVSQDSWGGTFSWAQISRASGNWPSGFVHFDDATLTNLAAPDVSGDPRVGATLVASSGSWDPADATLRYRWRADGINIPGATGPSLTLGPEQQGTTIVVRVRATKLGFPRATATSSTTAPVAPGQITNLSPPAVTGVPRVDETLTGTSGQWDQKVPGLTTSLQWLADGVAIPGATSATLRLDPSLIGKAVSLSETASAPGYVDVTAGSVETVAVVPGVFTRISRPAIVLSPGARRPQPGQTLSVDVGSFRPRTRQGAEVAVQWLRDGVPVPGATGSTYQLRNADLGSKISAEVTLTKPGYTTLTTPTKRTHRVRSTAHFHVRKTVHPHRVRLTIALSARGAHPVTGTVQVRSHGSLLAERRLRDGARSIVLKGLPSGVHVFRIRYAGSHTVRPHTVGRTARLR